MYKIKIKLFFLSFFDIFIEINMSFNIFPFTKTIFSYNRPRYMKLFPTFTI